MAVNGFDVGGYGGHSDTNLEEDLNVIKNSHLDVWDDLLGKIYDQKGRMKVESDDLRGSGISGRFLQTFISC